MKLKNIALTGLAGLIGMGLVAGGMRTHSRTYSKPSLEIEQQLSQNSLYQEIVAENQNPLKRELWGVYYDYGLPLFLHLTSKLTPDQKREIVASRYDQKTGKHKSYSADEQAVLWHLGANPTQPGLGKDYLLNFLEGSVFQK